MAPLTRRRLLTGTAASLAASPFAGPAFAQRGNRPAPPPSEVDCIIVGAGAAGIAAARRLAAANRSFTLIEASNRVGGRCLTDTASFGVPFDRGAHLIYNPESNPLTTLAARAGLEIYPAPTAQRIRIGRRYARDSELEDYFAAAARTSRSISDGARNRADVDCTKLLPRDLGEWQSTVEFALGPYNSAKDLDQISAVDMSRSGERNTAALCRQGYGALMVKLAEGIPVQLDTAVRLVDVTGRGAKVELATNKGTISGKHVIITASTNAVLDRIKFDGGLPKRHQDAFEKLKLGSFDHIALELAGNPLGLPRDEMVFEKTLSSRTAALTANVGGSPVSIISVGGKFGRELAEQGDKAMVEFAVEWLGGMFGPGVRKALGRTQVTQWNKDQWIQGAIATASPGWQGARRVLMEPLRNRVFFAGEAVHETAWGTVGGAWESGTRAADAVVRRILGQPDLPLPKAEPDPPLVTVTSPAQRQTAPSGWCATNPSMCKPPPVRRAP